MLSEGVKMQRSPSFGGIAVYRDYLIFSHQCQIIAGFIDDGGGCLNGTDLVRCVR